MVFSSLIFLYAFLPLCLVCYRFCRSLKERNVCLLVFSLVFYAWGEPKYVLLLMAMAWFDWFFALRIQASQKAGKKGRIWLALACTVNLGMIVFFKYSGMICSIFAEPGPFISSIALPLGISFYTFQLLTYVTDVYRGQAAAQKRYRHVLLYAALFHQCIAGPIVRYSTISKELFVRRRSSGEIPVGVFRFTVGLAKKVMLANPCGALADRMLLTDRTIADASAFAASIQTLSQRSVLGLWLGVAAFAFQIYFDFSAYSDMAIGMGKMLGLHYPENFDYPYISHSATEFWRRWHISLGAFLRDYVYIPMGGSRGGTGRTLFNLFVVWALTGLWHGASWNFVLWGLYWFAFAAAERLLLRRAASCLPSVIKTTFSHLYLILVALLGWVLFKYTDLRLAKTVLLGLFGFNRNRISDFQSEVMFRNNLYLLAFCAAASTPAFKKLVWHPRAAERNAVYRVFIYGLLPVLFLLVSTAGLVGNSYNPFLYFRF